MFDAGEGFPPYGLITGEPVPGWPEGGLFKPHLDIPAICEYANSQGVGMILYVNTAICLTNTGGIRWMSCLRALKSGAPQA